MTDEQKSAAPKPETKPAEPQAGDTASPQSDGQQADAGGDSAAKRQIKIGSQKPGYVADVKKKRKETVVPVLPKPVHKQQPREKFVSSDQASKVASYSAGGDAEQDAAAAVEATQTLAVSPAQQTPEPAIKWVLQRTETGASWLAPALLW